MNKRLLSQLMKDRVHGLQSSGVYFFRGDFQHILQGIAFEYTPRGLYVWSFLFPLFDLFGPHLSYSQRLTEHPFIEKGAMSEQAIADLVLASAEARITFDAKMPMSLSEFFNRNLLGFDSLRSPHLVLVQAAGLVLLGKRSDAANVLRECPPNLHPKHLLLWNQLKASVEQGEEAAQLLLDQVRKENLRAFGVSHG